MYIAYNQLVGAIPPELAGLSKLEVLYLPGNQLSGCVPNSLRDVKGTSFEVLALPFYNKSPDRAALVALYNAADGPNWLSAAPIWEWEGVTVDAEDRVTELSLTSNRLSGKIPAELGSLSDLRILYLGSNRLSGEIPPELGNLSNLGSLALWGNRLSGEIPPELGNLSNLELLTLMHNELTGCVPEGLRYAVRNYIEELGLPLL